MPQITTNTTAKKLCNYSFLMKYRFFPVCAELNWCIHWKCLIFIYVMWFMYTILVWFLIPRRYQNYGKPNLFENVTKKLFFPIYSIKRCFWASKALISIKYWEWLTIGKWPKVLFWNSYWAHHLGKLYQLSDIIQTCPIFLLSFYFFLKQ